MKIAIITYDVPHQKTQDLVGQLLLAGYNDLHFFALPFASRKARKAKYIHRFNEPSSLSPKDLANNTHCKYTQCKTEELCIFFAELNFDRILIAGAGLLPEKLALDFKIINSHPGYLPKVKGLDSLKWALLNEVEEIGVTTHFISDKADEGILIERRIIPLYKEDSFHSFALRQYRTEIDMLVKAISLVSEVKPSNSLADDSYQATLRMPLAKEEEMIHKFNTRRDSSPSIWE